MYSSKREPGLELHGGEPQAFKLSLYQKHGRESSGLHIGT